MGTSFRFASVHPGTDRRPRLWASVLLLSMASIFVIAVIEEPRYSFFGWIRAFAEAAMVGALADWYAVTALFKRPLGLPIPHTAIIPANRDRIAARIGNLTQQKLMTPEGLAKVVGSWRIADEVTAALLDRERRPAWSREICQGLRRALEASDNAAMQRLFRELGGTVVRGVSVAPLAGQLLSTFLQSPQRDRLLNDVFFAASESLDAHRDALTRLIAGKLPWSRLLSVMKLDDAIATKVLDAVQQSLRSMKDNPHDAMRVMVITRLEAFGEWLMHAEEAAKREAALKDKLLAHESLLQFFDDSWHSLKQWMLDDMDSETSHIRAYLDAVLTNVGHTLQADAELRTMLHDGLQQLIEALAGRHSNTIGEFVTRTVREWSADQMVETIEKEVGSDLQFIRINGTVVGGLVGILLHAIALWMERW